MPGQPRYLSIYRPQSKRQAETVLNMLQGWQQPHSADVGWGKIQRDGYYITNWWAIFRNDDGSYLIYYTWR